MDRRNTDMKNKIKKILLLGMTAMFTAGAAGTAVISCPVWADEAEQNSETAEEPKAEDAAVEEEIADQTDDKTENTDKADSSAKKSADKTETSDSADTTKSETKTKTEK